MTLGGMCIDNSCRLRAGWRLRFKAILARLNGDFKARRDRHRQSIVSFSINILYQERKFTRNEDTALMISEAARLHMLPATVKNHVDGGKTKQ